MKKSCIMWESNSRPWAFSGISLPKRYCKTGLNPAPWDWGTHSPLTKNTIKIVPLLNQKSTHASIKRSKYVQKQEVYEIPEGSEQNSRLHTELEGSWTAIFLYCTSLELRFLRKLPDPSRAADGRRDLDVLGPSEIHEHISKFFSTQTVLRMFQNIFFIADGNS